MYSPRSVNLLVINWPSSETFTSILVVLMFSFSNISLCMIPFTISRSGFIPALLSTLLSFSRSAGTISSMSKGSSPLLASGLISFIKERFNLSSSSLLQLSRNASTIKVVPFENPLGSAPTVEY